MSAISLRSSLPNSVTGSPGCCNTGSGYFRILRIISLLREEIYLSLRYLLLVPKLPKHQRREEDRSIARFLLLVPIRKDILRRFHKCQNLDTVKGPPNIVIGRMSLILKQFEALGN